MVIRNFDKLATSSLRRRALTIAEAGFEAINTTQAVERQFHYDSKKEILDVLGQKFNLKNYKRIVCVGFGKAALEAVRAIEKVLRGRIACGYVIDLTQGRLENIVSKVGVHPYPTLVNVQATKELVEMLEQCTQDDLVICVVSGGGSALLCYPYELSCESEVAIIKTLMAKGADIFELNTVRKHLSRVKGGQLAKIIYPATCISLIFSDVPGNDLSVVASGPTVKDTTTAGQAAEVLKKYDILQLCRLPYCKLVETPKEDKYFEKVYNLLFVSSTLALEAMKNKAEDLGFKTRIFSSAYQGEAKVLGPRIVSENKSGECLLGSGESTVKIIGKGKGGRNQEMALAALPWLSDRQTFLCLASDGHDNTEAAGAMVDKLSLSKAKALSLNPADYLETNDSFNFFERIDDLVFTGLTGSNVSDFFICVRD